MAYEKKNCPRGAKKSEKTILLCNQILEELKTGNKSSNELGKKFGIKEELLPNILVHLTYLAPIYDYKVNGKLYIGILK